MLSGTICVLMELERTVMDYSGQLRMTRSTTRTNHMARKVKETPILTGRALDRFNQEIKVNERKKVSDEERQRIAAAYRKFNLTKCV